MKTFIYLGLLSVVCWTLACNGTKYSYAMLNEENDFQQTSSQALENKYDILWVVDNSASMEPFQQNLIQNFKSFVKNFVALGLDFHIAVTTTDAYLALPAFQNNSVLSRFRDGSGNIRTGYPIIDSSTPNVIDTFTANANQGDTGDGDERAFSSFKAALQNPLNASFRRPDAYLAIIILSDEDDFSNSQRQPDVGDHDYQDPKLESVDSYVSFLDQLTNSSASNRRYNVSSITVKDQACLTKHLAETTSTIMGTRYLALTKKTGGVAGDICSASFADVLDILQGHIIELGSEFTLTRKPNPDSIQVSVNGTLIAQDANNGWTYDEATNTIRFHGSAVPAKNTQISIVFDPLRPK